MPRQSFCTSEHSARDRHRSGCGAARRGLRQRSSTNHRRMAAPSGRQSASSHASTYARNAAAGSRRAAGDDLGWAIDRYSRGGRSRGNRSASQDIVSQSPTLRPGAIMTRSIAIPFAPVANHVLRSRPRWSTKMLIGGVRPVWGWSGTGLGQRALRRFPNASRATRPPVRLARSEPRAHHGRSGNDGPPHDRHATHLVVGVAHRVLPWRKVVLHDGGVRPDSPEGAATRKTPDHAAFAGGDA